MIALDGEIIPPVIKGRKQTFDNRTAVSPLQHHILNVLAAAGQPIGERIGHLPRTGDIVDALGWPRNKSSFASVSRSLKRLEQAARIVSYSPSVATRGNGFHYAVKR